MTRPAKVALAVVLLLVSAACLVGPSKFGTSGRAERCKRCVPPPPPETERDQLDER